MTPTPRQLKDAGIDVDALREAEKKIADYEWAFRRILELRETGRDLVWKSELTAIVKLVYQPPKQRKAREAGKVRR